MDIKKKLATILVATSLISGCYTNENKNNQATNTLYKPKEISYLEDPVQYITNSYIQCNNRYKNKKEISKETQNELKKLKQIYENNVIYSEETINSCIIGSIQKYKINSGKRISYFELCTDLYKLTKMDEFENIYPEIKGIIGAELKKPKCTIPLENIAQNNN